MSWRVELKDDAEKQLKKLDKPIQESARALFARLETLENPHAIGKALTGPF